MMLQGNLKGCSILNYRMYTGFLPTLVRGGFQVP